VSYLRSNDAVILQGFEDLVARIPHDAVIICESNSLGKTICPARHIIVKSKSGVLKARAVSLLKRADLLVISDGQSGFPEIEHIVIKDDNSWHLLA
jgi:hypothetical protein